MNKQHRPDYTDAELTALELKRNWSNSIQEMTIFDSLGQPLRDYFNNSVLEWAVADVAAALETVAAQNPFAGRAAIEQMILDWCRAKDVEALRLHTQGVNRCLRGQRSR